jgi:hypothetical protein
MAAHPQALAAIVKASESYSIVASQDIVDVRGLKLWARGQPVSSSLQQRLLERKLQQPLEVCLLAQDGVTPFTLLDDLQSLIESDSNPLAPLLKPWASVLIEQAQRIPLHSVAQLLLTAALATRPNTLPHAVAGMALAGAMMASRNASVQDIRLAMLGGLLHDIGEVYIHPQYLDYSTPLDIVGHKHLVVHPRVAQLLLSTLTDYPQVLSRAVGEHHERLDRSGYPARLRDDGVSTLGRVLAVMEVTLGILRSPRAPLARASFALRVVPGEFDPLWTAFICEAARAANEDLACDESYATERIYDQLGQIDRQLEQTRKLALELHEQRRAVNVTDIVKDALNRLDRLRVAWNALGLWSLSSGELAANERFELELAEGELRQRIRSFQRECLLLSEGLIEVEKCRLEPLWKGLLDDRVMGAAAA